ncbi:glycosyltransferase family 1 protein [Sulfuricurvum sp. IAE1]|uniref:glycosyltransferase family protein n=1 Tax=Sulfuricurvum sp. IAE1 TaxID=2546102 RepID=UPI00104ACA79|nr:glycosyltransferase [Sulfuricurvum sp. IAE1]TDA62660.1 glycosyltransferase family 1 protein [Sulfuricurvum sp. IAE1]
MRLALFMPSDTPFYRGLFGSLQKAFERHGFTVRGRCGFLEGKRLNDFIAEYSPNVFFEMNRCKAEIDGFPEKITHVSWLVDLSGRKLEAIRGSELVCFFSSEWMADYLPEKGCKSLWLPPASDPDNYFPVSIPKTFESVFVGHIPKPWDQKLLERPICFRNSAAATFRDVVETFETRWGEQDTIVNNDRYLQEVELWLESRGRGETLHDDATLRYDIGCRIIRTARRKYFLDWLLRNESVEPMAIFGGENWKLWDDYARLYGGELGTPTELNEAFNRSKTVIHEGVGPHFRVFDAMLSGVPVVVRKSVQDREFGGLGTMAAEGEEYIALDVGQDRGLLSELLRHPETLRRIGENGRNKALAQHTWYHRLSETSEEIKKRG